MKVFNKVFRIWSTIESKREKRTNIKRLKEKTLSCFVFFLFYTLDYMLGLLVGRWSSACLTDQPLWQLSPLFCIFMPYLSPERLHYCTSRFRLRTKGMPCSSSNLVGYFHYNVLVMVSNHDDDDSFKTFFHYFLRASSTP